jgi:hypothetical protein
MGFTLFQVDLMLEHLWTGPRQVDIGTARRQVRGVLDVRPSAGVMIRLHVNAPPWWNASHPGECVEYADGPVDSPPTRGIERPLDRDLERCRRQSLASAAWRDEAGAVVGEMCRRLSRTAEGFSVIGIQVANGVFGEWAYFGFISHEPDTGPAMTRAFRAWLALRYGDDGALKAAWNDPGATLSGVEVPGLPDRTFTSDGVFRDPRLERRVMDYWRCQHETLASALLYFCKLVKESWPRPLVVGAFCGYTFSQFGRQAAGGHLAIDRILRSPHVDFLCGPQTYQPYSRDLGGTGMSRGLPESCGLHGKLWLDEMDQPTHLGTSGDRSFSCTLPDALSLLRRNVAQPLMRGHGLWYYDFGPRFQSGWWDDPALCAEIAKLRGFFEQRTETDWSSPADVLMVCDLEVFYGTGHSFAADPVSEPALDQVASALYRTGACFHMVWLCDLELVDWSRYRTVVFANTWLLTPARRVLIRERAAGEGRHLVWVYAPGYNDGESLSPRHIAETTGIEVERIEMSGPVRGEGLFSSTGRVTPLFVAQESAGEVVSRFEGTRLPCITRAGLPGHTAWFCSLPPVDPRFLRRIIRESGGHIWSDAGDVLFAGWGLLCVHTVEGGLRTVHLRSGRQVSAELAPRSTTFFDVETGCPVLE